MKFCFCKFPSFSLRKTNRYNKNTELSKLSFDDVDKFSLNGQTHQAKVVDVYDGDTVHVLIHVFGENHRFMVRLLGLDSPEMAPLKSQPRREELKTIAYLARNRMIQLTTDVADDFDINERYSRPLVKEMCGKSRKMVTLNFGDFDLHGRPLAHITTPEHDDLSQVLINENLAQVYDGGTKNDPLFIFKRRGELEAAVIADVAPPVVPVPGAMSPTKAKAASDAEARIIKLKEKAEARVRSRAEAIAKVKAQKEANARKDAAEKAKK
ncbi:MAG: hypothetical protein JKX76_00775 [Colwellia sp.]|nr:hypothetical protein [Colwellia sp.]